MAKQDEILITYLDDGTVVSETDEISDRNHALAEKLLGQIARSLGGKTTKTKRRETHTHSHEGLHTHA